MIHYPNIKFYMEGKDILCIFGTINLYSISQYEITLQRLVVPDSK